MLITLPRCETNVAIHQSGDRPWVILSHSLGASLAMWTRQVERLADRFNVVAYDLRGHGGSPPTDPPITIADLAGDVADMMDALGIEQAFYIGLSLGGGIGVALGLDYPDRVLGIAACNCRLQLPPEAAEAWRARIARVGAEGMEPLVEPTLSRWLNPDFIARRPDEADRVRDMIRGTSPKGYIGCAGALIRGLDQSRVGELKCPVLYLAGAQDVAAPAAELRALSEATPGSSFVELDPASHLSNVENPDDFEAAIDGFLTSAGGDPAGVGERILSNED